MSFVYKEMSCRLCGEKIEMCDDVIFVPKIFCSRNDPLFLYNDTVCHRECFDSADNSKRILECIMLVRSEYEKKECCICGKKIVSADDFIFVPIISSDSSSTASKYNCKSFHKKCYEKSDLKKYLQDGYTE